LTWHFSQTEKSDQQPDWLDQPDPGPNPLDPPEGAPTRPEATTPQVTNVCDSRN